MAKRVSTGRFVVLMYVVSAICVVFAASIATHADKETRGAVTALFMVGSMTFTVASVFSIIMLFRWALRPREEPPAASDPAQLAARVKQLESELTTKQLSDRVKDLERQLAEAKRTESSPNS